MEEVWKDVVGYEGLYQVSNLGNVKRNHVLRYVFDNNGYCFVTLSKMGISKCFRVHRLVAETFLPVVEGKKEVNHKNGNKKDNRVDNLEWVSHKENMEHANKNGLISGAGRKRTIASMNKARIKPILQYKNGVFIKEYKSVSQAIKEIKTKHITCVAKGKRKQAGGYEWRYK